LDTFGFDPRPLLRFRNALSKRSGIVVVAGPTGSGKTTTLFAALAALNRSDVQIVTVEREVELHLPGVNQIQLRPALGLTAAAALQSLDDMLADIVMLDEIPDAETARAVVGLAQHGHLVLSTLPTRDAPSAVWQLLGMGIEPFSLTSMLNAVVAQRLVRRICDKCRFDETANVPAQALVDVGFAPDAIGSLQLMKGIGCEACNGTGYRGRVGLFEVMEISDGVADRILGRATTADIRRQALEEGMLSLRMAGLEKVKQGLTTIEEVVRGTDL
jgi:type IV pilus assembly protein PilB